MLAGLRSILERRMAAWIRRRQGSDTLPLTLQRRRIYILPTRAGVGFALLLFFMFVAGLNYANSLALFLTFLLAGFALVAMHQCHRNLLGAQLETAAVPPTFAQRPGTLQLTLGSATPVNRYRIEAGIGREPTTAVDVRAGSQQRVDLPVAAPSRGVVHIGRLKVTSAHPFGLFRAWTWIHSPLEMWVYPRPQGSAPMPFEGGRHSGKFPAGSLGADEWLGLRPFRDGDSPRQVDWKAYAREAPLLVKEYSSSGTQLRVFRLAQLSAVPVEAALEQLARWIVDAEAQGDRYGIELPTTRVAPDRGPEHRHKCLAALALYALPPRQP